MRMAEGIQYIINANGDRIALIIPIKQFESMLADVGLTLDDYETDPSRARRTLFDQLRATGKIEI